MNAVAVRIPLYWIRSHRGGVGREGWVVDHILNPLAAAAERVGLDLRVIDVDDVVVWGEPGTCEVYVRGTKVEPTTCFFHTKLLPTPAAQPDVLRHLSICSILDELGFCTTIPPMLNLVNDDKLLALVQRYGASIRWLPTLRVATRQFYTLDFDGRDITFPVVVKPANWGGGSAILRVENRSELNAILQLAGAGELTMVVQPWLGPDLVDVRVYCVDGLPDIALARRPTAGSLSANLQRGGSGELIPVPPPLVEPARQVAQAIGLSYIGIDFLESGGEYWLSEIEVDAGPGGYDELSDLRFGAYRRLFERFLDTRRAAAYQG